jgi:NitT/TauT family transport system substrate-binding protein
MLRSTVSILAMLALETFCSGEALANETLRFGIALNWMPWASAQVAEQKGFWKEEGLDVTVTNFIDYDNFLSAIRQKKFDLNMMMLGNAVEFIAEGQPISILYQNDWSNGGDKFILSKKTADVRTLKGKKIGLYSNTAPVGVFLEQVLAKNSLKITDVSIRQISKPESLGKVLEQGLFAGAVIYDPFATEIVKAKSGRQIYTTADFPGVMPEGIVVSNEFQKSHPEAVSKFMRAWFRALAWQLDPKNAAEFNRIALKYTMVDGTTKEADLPELIKGGKVHSTKSEIMVAQSSISQYVSTVLSYMQKLGKKIGVKDIEHYYAKSQIPMIEASATSANLK